MANFNVLSLADIFEKADRSALMRQQSQMEALKLAEMGKQIQSERALSDLLANSVQTVGGSPAVAAQPEQLMPERVPATPEQPAIPGRSELSWDKAFSQIPDIDPSIRGNAVLKLQQMRMADELKRMEIMAKIRGGGDQFEGPVLFSDEGGTFRSTKDGRIVPVKVEGGAKIAPPVYPFQYTPPEGGPPRQGVITKPQAARMAAVGPANLGMTEAQGKQNLENRVKFKKIDSGLDKTESTLKALDNFLTQKGTVFGIGPINSTDRREAQTLHANVLAGLREIDDMGVLQPGELPFLERQIADPGNWMNYGQADAIRKQIETVRSRIKNLRPIIRNQYEQGSQQTTIRNDSEYNELPSGTLFVGPDGKTRRKP